MVDQGGTRGDGAGTPGDEAHSPDDEAGTPGDEAGTGSGEGGPERLADVVRRRPIRTAATVAVLVGLVALGRWLGDGDASPFGEAAPRTPTAAETEVGQRDDDATTTSTAAGDTVSLEALELTVDAVEVRSPGGAMEELPERARRRILATVESYLREATLRPLLAPTTRQRSDSGGDLTRLFTSAARSRLSGPDRATLVDEGVGVAVRGVSVERAAVELSVLGDGDGRPRLATVALDARVVAHTLDGPVVIVRTGELVLVPSDDRWLIDGYRLNVQRELGGDAAQSGV